MNSDYRINRQIRARKVRLISPEGNQMGIVNIEDALRRAQDYELDLVEVANKADPPVCRIIDYGKFRYEKMKQQRESKKKQKLFEIKEIRIRPKIGENDYQVKVRHAVEFIKDGHKIKFTLMFRGREMAHQEFGKNVLERVMKDMAEVAQVEQRPVLQNRFMTMVLAPKA